MTSYLNCLSQHEELGYKVGYSPVYVDIMYQLLYHRLHGYERLYKYTTSKETVKHQINDSWTNLSNTNVRTNYNNSDIVKFLISQ